MQSNAATIIHHTADPGYVLECKASACMYVSGGSTRYRILGQSEGQSRREGQQPHSEEELSSHQQGRFSERSRKMQDSEESR